MERLIARGLALLVAASGLVWLDAAAQSGVVLFTEDFDAVTVPDVPPTWTVTGSDWATSATMPSPGSGGNNLVHAGVQSGEITTPAIDLRGISEARLRYDARRTSSYPADSLAVSASIDGGATFPIMLRSTGALPDSAGSYEAIETPLPDTLLGEAQVVLRFEAYGGSGGSSNLRLDDVTVTGTRPFRADPDTLSFFTSIDGVEVLTFSVTNESGQAETVGAPVVVGDGFTIAPLGPVVLLDGGTHVYSVTFTPPGTGVYTGSVTLAHTWGELVVALSGTTSGGRFGFEHAGLSMLEETEAAAVPLHLAYTHPTNLQGLEFTVVWNDSLLQFDRVDRGEAVSDTALWRLSVLSSGLSARVLLLGEGTDGLAATDYEPLLTLRMTTGSLAGAVARSVRLTLQDLISALAVPESGDASVVADLEALDITVEPRQAHFVASTASIDFGNVVAGTTASAPLTVANTDGTRDLSITGIVGTNERFSIDPASAVVAAGAVGEFTVTFAPTTTSFGRQSERLVFTHDGEGGPTFELEVTGRGTGGRGDSDGDGHVDAVDLVEGVDFVIGALAASEAQRMALDVYPFPTGDLALDVRDLTVLAHALARGAWPDAHVLPEAVSPGSASLEAGVQLHIRPAGGGWIAEIINDRPVRAVQVAIAVEGLRGEAVAAARAVGRAGVVTARGAGGKGLVRALLYRDDGSSFAPGRYRLVEIPAGADATWSVREATAVDAARRRIPVMVDPAVAIGVEPGAERPDAGPPYPNPFRPSTGEVLRIPLGEPTEVEVYDVRGRCVWRAAAGPGEVAWDGADLAGRRLAPGVYFVRAGKAMTGVVVR